MRLADLMRDRAARHKARVFMLTFLAYMCYHLVRKVPSVVKGVLHPVSSTGKSVYDPVTNPGWAPFNQDIVPEKVAEAGYRVSHGSRGVDGKYSCVETREGTCLEFLQQTGGEDPKLLTRVPSSFRNISCPPSFENAKCWVLISGQDQDIIYAQDYDGTLPAQSVAGEAVDVIRWEIKTGGGEFRVDKDIKMMPDITNGGELLGLLDTIFLGCYTIGLFFSGYIGDRMSLRLLLLIGMLGSGTALFFLAAAHIWDVHSLFYFILINAVFGFFQSTGWPSVVGIMGRWFGHGARGTVMGIWNCHTSVGNILGSVIAATAVGAGMHEEDWPLGYAIPGLIICCAGVVVYLFIVPDPRDVGIAVDLDSHEQEDNVLDAPLLPDPGDGSDREVVDESASDAEKGLLATFQEALAIPGVVPFALSLMFCKMSSYSLLYWGPYFLGSMGFTAEKSGYLCTFLDVGGMFGGMAAGYLSDRYPAALVAFCFQVVSIPVILLYEGETSSLGTNVPWNIVFMIIVGFFINAPYALITTAVTADLGTRVGGDVKMLAFVTGLIDGTGSFGAMLQGIVVGAISSSSWAAVWYFLCVAQTLSALMISRLVYQEVRRLVAR